MQFCQIYKNDTVDVCHGEEQHNGILKKAAYSDLTWKTSLKGHLAEDANAPMLDAVR